MTSRQKKLEKKKAKRGEKKRQIARAGAKGVAERMALAATAPLLDCILYQMDDEQGIAQLVISRRLKDGDIAAAVFLVDRYCLGIKNGLGRVYHPGDYRDFLKKMEEPHRGERIDAESGRRFVEDAIAYARKYGFEPHVDARKAFPLFGDVDASRATRMFEFGKDGKPLFIAGPYDSPDRQRLVIESLRRTAGEGNFDYILPMSQDLTDGIDLDSLEWDDEWSEGDEPDDESIDLIEQPAPRAFIPPPHLDR